MKKISAIVIVLLLLLLAVTVNYSYSLRSTPNALVNGARYEPASCWFKPSYFPQGLQPNAWLFGFKIKRIECGYLNTRKEQGASPFRLPVVIVRDSLWRNSKHPILNLSGGPGASAWLDQASINNFWLPTIDKNNWQHDIVLYDSRGTGLSQPSLHCNNFFQDSLKILSRNLTPEKEAKVEYSMLQQCYQRLVEDKTKLSALRHLGTIRSANDVADLASLLRVDAWHLYGTSYGTRLALEVARTYPDHVASMILDSVYPQEIDGEETMPDLYLDAVERMIKACEEEPTCALQYSELHKKLYTILRRLRDKPITLTLEYNRQPVIFVMTPSRFFSLLYDAGYDINSVVTVPNVIQSLYADNRAALRYLAQDSLNIMLDETFSNPVYMEVECNENEIKNRQSYIANINKKYLYYPTLRRWQLATIKDDFCNIWGKEESSASFHQPVVSDKPTLILAGQLDSATPAQWSKAVAARLPNSEYHQFQASGHAVLYNVSCAKDIVRRFLNSDENYPEGCQSDNPYTDGQRAVWKTPDVGDIF
ncbi:MAG TPA: alpha/beta fold hydrolase [Leucothrix mucor]|uniref:Proline iminopeptidase n=1 Tax=Leucothrix mucor TaxID=45248 RepID=A0A7V2SZ11_LEUMU|nr:alpha/beta fold hydrolase [Leucothrix mucor]